MIKSLCLTSTYSVSSLTVLVRFAAEAPAQIPHLVDAVLFLLLKTQKFSAGMNCNESRNSHYGNSDHKHF